jgi:hypothetical protein
MSKMYDELAPWWPLLSPAADYEEEDWLRLLTEAGFEDVRVVPLEHSQVEPGAHEVFVARRPATASAPRG